MVAGGCHCGAVRYEIAGAVIAHTLCHCQDCRRHAGAPIVGWTTYRQGDVQIVKGAAAIYVSSAKAARHFCRACGTGLFYINEGDLPGTVDVQSATLDDPEAVPPHCHIQVAERLAWMRLAHTLPEFERFPPES